MPRQPIMKRPEYIQLITEIIQLENYEQNPTDNPLSYMWKLQQQTGWTYSNLCHKIDTLVEKNLITINEGKPISKIKVNWQAWAKQFIERYFADYAIECFPNETIETLYEETDKYGKKIQHDKIHFEFFEKEERTLAAWFEKYVTALSKDLSKYKKDSWWVHLDLFLGYKNVTIEGIMKYAVTFFAIDSKEETDEWISIRTACGSFLQNKEAPYNFVLHN